MVVVAVLGGIVLVGLVGAVALVVRRRNAAPVAYQPVASLQDFDIDSTDEDF